MKKILLLLMIMAVIGFSVKVQAQCIIQNPIISIKSSNQVGLNCQVNFDLSFEFDNNGGNKTFVI